MFVFCSNLISGGIQVFSAHSIYCLCLPLVYEDEHLLSLQPDWYHDVPVYYPVDVPVTGYPAEGETVLFLLRQCSSCQRMAVED